jgi:3-methyladenine DNA glycosylase AlkC
MRNAFSEAEVRAGAAIVQEVLGGEVGRGVERLRALKDEIHAAIPEKLRIGRGITWVVERIATLLAAQGLADEQLRALALAIHAQLAPDDLLIGAPIFMLADYGSRRPAEVFEFFEAAAGAEHWVVREFAAGAFRKVIGAQREAVLLWLKGMAQSADPNQRRLAGEALRPVTMNKWLNGEPEYALSVLRLMFREKHPYPRTSVGNNLSDLSRRQPELIFGLVKELVASGDANSYWIAYRACRNLVKKEPQRVMNLLGVGEYHYKDRNFYRETAA